VLDVKQAWGSYNTLSVKNDPNLKRYSSKLHRSILMIFGKIFKRL